MPNKMLIDATHPEETRVVVLRGNRVEEFDFESANRRLLRGNIYLAKVTRVEPSLQAAFVDYGGNRHGFLAFSEIHPDYYQIPVADRQALIAEEERAQRAADEDADHRARSRHRRRGASRRDEARRSKPIAEQAVPTGGVAADAVASGAGETPVEPMTETTGAAAAPEIADPDAADEAREAYESPMGDVELSPEHLAEEAAARAEAAHEAGDTASDAEINETLPAEDGFERDGDAGEAAGQPHEQTGDNSERTEAANGNGGTATAENGNGELAEEEAVESVGGADALDEVQERTPRFRRQYKIQEVIKRRQVMLVQVVKEERGSKGAALTTYLSLAGRYSVLMPNTARGGGISRKITSAEDRGRLKEIAQELEVPQGMGVILRTAGASRTKQEVKRDFEYLMRLWEQVRDLTLKSTAPKLVYEEGSLTKRSIRDLYNKEIDEIVVAGDAAYKEAKDFMRMLVPSHAKQVKFYKDAQPIFTRFGVESQLDAMFSPVVQLKSGGYIVINQAEALVAIDVNSGRATREHHIEDTALKTNLEAADEVARQLRLRDLAGLIVIDFIDMDEGRNNRTVERRLKEALRHDRARIQVGRISHFGLLEMSRQRIRSSVLESSTEKCPVCGGSGHVRSVSSVALQILRSVEEMLMKGATHNLNVRTRAEVALYALNHKRAHLRALEDRFQIVITITADPSVAGAQSFAIDHGEQVHTPEAARAIAATQPVAAAPIEEEQDLIENQFEAEIEAEEAEAVDEVAALEAAPSEESLAERPHSDSRHGARDGGRRGRRRGRPGRGGEPREHRSFTHDTVSEHAIAHEDHDGGDEGAQPHESGAAAHAGGENSDQRDGGRRRRRRGRRGGRRNRRNDEEIHGRHSESFSPYEANGEIETPAEVQEAVADLDRPSPTFADERPTYDQNEPAYLRSEAQPAAAEAPESEPPRRRSTIRESFGAPIAPAGTPQSAPVVSSSGGDESAAPKRGWWGRRLLGGNK